MALIPDDATDIGDYLLGELALEDRLRIERRMRADPAFRDEVERLIPVRDQLRRMPSSAWRAPEAARPAGVRPAHSDVRGAPSRHGTVPRKRRPTLKAALRRAVLAALRAASRAHAALRAASRARGRT